MDRFFCELLVGPDQVNYLLREHQSEWLQHDRLQRICLLGSAAHNEGTATRDMDVGVELPPPTPYATVHSKRELNKRLRRKVVLGQSSMNSCRIYVMSCRRRIIAERDGSSSTDSQKSISQGTVLNQLPASQGEEA